jgi:2-oxo-hept-3-ene-1,7-dioate hydratase
MLDAGLIGELAGRLDEAERAGKQIRQFSLEFPGIAIEDAYAIQRAWVEVKAVEFVQQGAEIYSKQ